MPVLSFNVISAVPSASQPITAATLAQNQSIMMKQTTSRYQVLLLT